MGRNKFIYALSDRSLVIDSALGSGGTWEGALEVLAQKWVPLFVRTPGNGPGNAVLVEKGGIAFTFMHGQGEDLLEYFERTTPSAIKKAEFAPPQQALLSMDTNVDDGTSSTVVATRTDVELPVAVAPIETPELPVGRLDAMKIETLEDVESGDLVDGRSETVVSAPSVPISLDMYGDFLTKLALALASGPLSEEEVAERLVLEKGQAKVWLKRAAEMGRVEKLKKPVRFAQGRQSSLLA
jgi:predicted Rossmann fold nucleotide-binding protein DprA/Smf involved in DNA uptake